MYAQNLMCEVKTFHLHGVIVVFTKMLFNRILTNIERWSVRESQTSALTPISSGDMRGTRVSAGGPHGL